MEELTGYDLSAEELRYSSEIINAIQEEIPKLSVSVGVAFSKHGFSDDLFERAENLLCLFHFDCRRSL